MGNSAVSEVNNDLIVACQQGEIGKAKHFIKLGADINFSDDGKQTPLMWACACGHLNIVQYLIQNNARLTDVDKDGYTCLHWAVIEKRVDVAKYLIHNHCKPSSNKTKTDNNNGDSNDNNNNNSTNYLNIDCKNTQGDTPLHKAIYYSQKEIAQALINANANINEQNNIKQTPLDKARKKDIKVWLKTIGAKANVKKNSQIEGENKQDNNNSDAIVLSAEDRQYLKRKQMKEAVVLWLKTDLSFPEYVDKFIDNGYDRFDAIFEMDKSDLIGIGIKVGHCKILLNSIQGLKREYSIQESYEYEQQQPGSQQQPQQAQEPPQEHGVQEPQPVQQQLQEDNDENNN